MVSADIGIIALAAWVMGYLHKLATWREWGILALAAILCFSTADTWEVRRPIGMAGNVTDWLLLAATSVWQREISII
jgi:hypothetical protein